MPAIRALDCRDQLADGCRASPDGGRLVIFAILTCDKSLYRLQGRAFGTPAPGLSPRSNRELSRGMPKNECVRRGERMTIRARASAGNVRGTVRVRGVGLPRPLCAGALRGRGAERWAVVPAFRSPVVARRYARLRHHVSRSARDGPASAPGVPAPGESRRHRAGTPRIVWAGPLHEQGHPKILSNRSAESIFGTHPCARSLCRPWRA